MAKKILVAEDEKSLRTLLELSLEMAGFEVQTATNGEEAKALINDEIDLVMTDLQMPVMDGLRLVEWIRSELGPTPPVLVLTAQSRNPSHEQALEAGANSVAFKPVSIKTLIAQINELLT